MFVHIMKGVEARNRASLELAWITAILGRAQKIPPLEKLFQKPAAGPERAAMLRAEIRAHARGMPKRKWSEWQKRQSDG